MWQVRYEIMFEMLKQRSLWFQLTVSLVLNWIVGPLLMTGLAWATLPDLDHYRNGNHLPQTAATRARSDQIVQDQSVPCAICLTSVLHADMPCQHMLC